MRTAVLCTLILVWVFPHAAAQDKKTVWKPVQFAIVRFNGGAPQSWNIYHFGKHANLLVRIWKRYLYIDTKEGEVYDIDPQKVKPEGENVEWSLADLPDDPIETTEWRSRDVGLVRSMKFRFGKNGHTLELQIPLQANGKPAY
jgi:hypothetical protein